MSNISKEFLQKIAKERLDEFFNYSQKFIPSNQDENQDEYLLKMKTMMNLTVHNFEFKDKESKDKESIFDNIKYMENTSVTPTSIIIFYPNFFLSVTIDKTVYQLYVIELNSNYKYYIKYNNFYYEFIHFYEYMIIFTCIAILFSKPDYSDIIEKIIGNIFFNPRNNCGSYAQSYGYS